MMPVLAALHWQARIFVKYDLDDSVSVAQDLVPVGEQLGVLRNGCEIWEVQAVLNIITEIQKCLSGNPMTSWRWLHRLSEETGPALASMEKENGQQNEITF
jgi:hypothetical protein